MPGESELRARLRACAATCELADGRLSPLAGGLSNEAWRLDAAGQAWFVRRGNPDAARLGVDRAAECTVLGAVAAAGLAPEVVACEPAAQLLVTRWVHGHTWQSSQVHEAGNLRRVAAQIRRLHELPVPAGAPKVAYSRQARHLAASLAATDATAAALGERAARAFARIEERGHAASLCHHDLHHLNIVDDGVRLWFVDWEYAGRGDPLLDVAGFLAMHELGPEATAIFVDAYDRLHPADLLVLSDARWVFDYVQWLWYRVRFGEASGAAGRVEQALAQRLLRCNN